MLKKINLIYLLFIFSCKTNSQENKIQSDIIKTPSPNYMQDGFTVKLDSEKNNAIVVENKDGSLVGTTSIQSSSLSLNQETLADGSVIFRWPQSSEVIVRNYDYLAKIMSEYSTLVGTVLRQQEAFGPGARTWFESLRGEQTAFIEKAYIEARNLERNRVGSHWPDNIDIENITNPWCNAVVDQFVNRLVPEGSNFRQYGNCGEGGRLAACLAKKVGFNENEIKLCASANDHFFAMVQRDAAWCVLDRWNIVGDSSFNCNMNVDDVKHKVTLNGQIVVHKWYENVACLTMDEFLKSPDLIYTKAFSTIPQPVNINENGDVKIHNTCWAKKDNIIKLDEIRKNSTLAKVDMIKKLKTQMARDSCLRRLTPEDFDKIATAISEPTVVDLTLYLSKYRYMGIF